MPRNPSALFVVAMCLLGAAAAVADDGKAGAPPDSPKPELSTPAVTADEIDAVTDEKPADWQPAVAPGEFRCPADNEGWWKDAKEGGWVGYGETWDLHTCEEGKHFYFPGATSRWKDFRKPRKPRVLSPRPSGKPVDVEFYSVILPTVAFGSIGMLGVLAWLIALFTRKKKLDVVDVSCPKCSTTIPVIIDDRHNKNMFCPACGGCSVQVVGHGKDAICEVHILDENDDARADDARADDGGAS